MLYLIGISGKKQTGKDTVASIIKTYFQPEHAIVCLSFANPLKCAATTIFGIGDFENNKETKIMGEYSKRDILKQLGDVSRSIDENVFLNNMKRRLDKCPNNSIVIITDVRFDNEAKFVRENGGVVLCIDASKRVVSTDTHVTERGVSSNLTDYTVYNNETTDMLYDEVYSLLGDLF